MGNKIRVMELIDEWFSKKDIRKKLSLTHKGINGIYKILKQTGLTAVVWWNSGSGCDCNFNESVNWCECGCDIRVGRATTLTIEWEKYLKNSK